MGLDAGTGQELSGRRGQVSSRSRSPGLSSWFWVASRCERRSWRQGVRAAQSGEAAVVICQSQQRSWLPLQMKEEAANEKRDII